MQISQQPVTHRKWFCPSLLRPHTTDDDIRQRASHPVPPPSAEALDQLLALRTSGTRSMVTPGLMLGARVSLACDRTTVNWQMAPLHCLLSPCLSWEPLGGRTWGSGCLQYQEPGCACHMT